MPKTEQQERSQIKSRLRAAGIRHTLDELYHDPRLERQCTAELLELLKSPYSLSTRVHIAEAFFDRKPKRAQKREAIDIVLKLFREHRGASAEESDAPQLLSFLAVNGLAACIEASDADAIIQMTLDPRYGLLRTSFTYVLYRIGTPAAIACLREMTKDPVVASSALYVLARMNVDGVAELCDKALKIPGVQYTDMIKQIRAKLKRQLAKKPAAPAGPSHVTKQPTPQRPGRVEHQPRRRRPAQDAPANRQVHCIWFRQGRSLRGTVRGRASAGGPGRPLQVQCEAQS
jgi:hypothetical protein